MNDIATTNLDIALDKLYPVSSDNSFWTLKSRQIVKDTMMFDSDFDLLNKLPIDEVESRLLDALGLIQGSILQTNTPDRLEMANIVFNHFSDALAKNNFSENTKTNILATILAPVAHLNLFKNTALPI